ncbi:unnamed protein product [Cuscuta campestris]|uniref:Uncharacterized protein n=1 Tax=Cuscuta campestris TaxID=132261 RepID=A0A484MYE6_9ASTE|nr:unnamed protein product [Cuscuta campestris]
MTAVWSSTIVVLASAVALRLSAVKLSAIVLSIATAALLPAACRRTTAALLPETDVSTVAEGGQDSPLITGSSWWWMLSFQEEKRRSCLHESLRGFLELQTPGSRDPREDHVEFVKRADSPSLGHPRHLTNRQYFAKFGNKWR